jgi:hypothetical protein
LEQLSAGETVVVLCDIEPVVRVRQVLEAMDWEIVERTFSAPERSFRLTARKRGS